uniref:inactive tyrosine-protein kinase 7-like n=1 Tax=Styela clava TaxID=7725 RepID=UPI00193A4D66|nr:inactive tyrosine-protein kinase 7-like [Styela clava]
MFLFQKPRRCSFVLFISVVELLAGYEAIPASSDNVFKVLPKSQDVNQGRSAILQCSLKTEFVDSYTLSWLEDGKEIKNGRRRHVGSDGYLHLDTVDKDLDSGKFQCLATNIKDSLDEQVTDPVTLNIKWVEVGAVTLRVPAGNTDILPGARVVLKCNVTGKPAPQNKDISWFLNEKDVNKLLERNIIVNRGRLVIEKAQLGMYDGTYSCCATVGLLEKKCSVDNYDLYVRDIAVPLLVTPPEDVIVRLSGNAKFVCDFDSIPPPTIEWSRDADILKPKTGKDCRICEFPNGTLIINDVKERFQGKYTCKAAGIKGDEMSASATLSIAYIDDFSNPQEEIEFLDLGNDLEKVCDPPNALPPANIIWFKNGKRIAISDESASPRVTVSGRTLVILSIQASDEGKYSCVAENMAGNVKKFFIFRIRSAPILKSELVSRTEKEGDDVTLRCHVDSVPEPFYTWYQNSTLLKSDPHYSMTDNELKINGIMMKDAANYQCLAQNALGHVSSTAFIHVEEQLKFDPLPMDTCAEIGTRSEIVCGARGVKNPSVSWTVKLITGGSTIEDQYKIITDGDGKANKTLVFLDPKPGDAWEAFCTANEVDNTLSSKTKRIFVSVGRRPEIIVPPQGATVFTGTPFRLDCKIGPKLSWDLSKVHWTVYSSNSSKTFSSRNNSEEVSYHNIMNNGSFYIKNVSKVDSATYLCSYTDCGITVQAEAVLDVAERDNPITSSSEPGDNFDDNGTPQYKKIQTIALAVGSSVAYLILTIAIIVYCRRKNQHNKNVAKGSESNVEEINGEMEERLMSNGFSSQVKGQTKKNGVAMLMEPVIHLNDEIESLQYDSNNLERITVIGSGNFGEVFLSKAPGLFPNLTEDILVMVKELQPLHLEKESNHSANNCSMIVNDETSEKSRHFEFNREIRLLYMTKHENVVKLLGVCSKYTDSPTNPDHLITEYLEWGILKLCLQASKEGKLQRFNKLIKMRMCCQIAAGLDHLTKLGLTHQDVATRNCVISSKMLIKLSVLSLTEEGFENEYTLHNGKLSPIRWMAPESLLENKIELQSDVWSFGVTCWEIFTFGETPYSDLTDKNFLDAMQEGHLPTLPPLENSKRITSLISKCCHENPASRPEFHQIVKKLQSILGLDAKSEKPAVTSSRETEVDVEQPLLSSSAQQDLEVQSNVNLEVKT